MDHSTERFDILDDNGNNIGTATRAECHGGTFHLHPVVHVLVFDDMGRLLLQKRSSDKEIQPGKWDTSVGGHLMAGELLREALIRETEEELGIAGADFERLYSYIMKSDVERELVTTFLCRWGGPVKFQPDEIETVAFFTPEEIEAALGSNTLTPNFEDEWRRFVARQAAD